MKAEKTLYGDGISIFCIQAMDSRMKEYGKLTCRVSHVIKRCRIKIFSASMPVRLSSGCSGCAVPSARDGSARGGQITDPFQHIRHLFISVFIFVNKLRLGEELAKEKRHFRRYTILTTLFIFLFLVSGCGYSLHPQSALPAKEVSIGLIENKTTEPKLQDKLNRALTEEFMKQGVRVVTSADYTVAAVISRFDMVSMSEKEGVTVDYRVTVNVDFRVLDRSGRVVEAKSVSSPFIVSVNEEVNLGILLASKEVAEEKTMRDVAMEIVGELLFR
jgi:outer membrane lipopolysaccharide assembly protein LptE/RlpB